MPSFASAHLLPEDGSTVDAKQEEIIKWCSQGIYAGGSDTVRSLRVSLTCVLKQSMA